MVTDAGGILLTDGVNRVFFHPPVHGNSDRFWQTIDLVGGPFKGSINASSYESPEALDGFLRQLIALYKTLQGEAALPNSYDNIKLKLVGNGLGHVRVEVHVTAFPSTYLSFCFSIDQTQLPTVIAAVKRIVLSFEQSEQTEE